MELVIVSVLLLPLLASVSTYHIQKEVYWHCFDIYQVKPEAQNVTLLCSDTYMEILDITYIRPLQVGDSVCTNMTYNYDLCCKSWRNDHTQCIVPYAYNSVLIDKCEHQNRCDIVLEPYNMYAECQASCSGGSSDAICWSRGVVITYVCYSMEENETTVIVSDDNTTGIAETNTEDISTTLDARTEESSVSTLASTMDDIITAQTSENGQSTIGGSTKSVPTSTLDTCDCSGAVKAVTGKPHVEPDLRTTDWVIILAVGCCLCFAVGVIVGSKCTRCCLEYEKDKKLRRAPDKTQTNTSVEDSPNECPHPKEAMDTQNGSVVVPSVTVAERDDRSTVVDKETESNKDRSLSEGHIEVEEKESIGIIDQMTPEDSEPKVIVLN